MLSLILVLLWYELGGRITMIYDKMTENKNSNYSFISRAKSAMIVGIFLGSMFAGCQGLSWLSNKYIAPRINGPTDAAISEKSQIERSLLPTVANNQMLIVDPKMKNGQVPIEYLLLTDVNRDGSWDTAELVRAGYTTGDWHKTCFYTVGYGPSQSVPDYDHTTFREVSQSFFAPYDNLDAIIAK